MLRNYFLVLGFIVLFSPSLLYASGAGYRKGQATASEVLALPQFCWWEFDSAYKDTKSQIRNCGVGTNHYCMALVEFNRAKRQTERYKKRGKLNHALREVEYTLGWMKRENKMNSCSIREHVFQTYRDLRMAYAGAGLPVPEDKYPVQSNANNSSSKSDGPLSTVDQTSSQSETTSITNDNADQKQTPTDTQESSIQEIGSPTNPYCRFCPD